MLLHSGRAKFIAQPQTLAKECRIGCGSARARARAAGYRHVSQDAKRETRNGSLRPVNRATTVGSIVAFTGAVALSRRNLTAIAGVAVILLLVLFSLPIAVEPRIKQRLVNALGERFDSEVQLETLTVSLLPRPRLSGRGLVLRHKHRTDVPPLVTIASFSGEAGLVGLLSDPVTHEQHPSGGLGDQRPTRRSEPERRRAG